MRIKPLFRMFICMLGALVIISCIFPVRILAKDKYKADDEVLKVFFPLQAGFAQIDENGIYSGYTYEYLMKIAQLTGWRYEFIEVKATNKSLSEGLNKIETGELHLSGAMVYSDELAERYEYSNSYGSTNYTLIAPVENKELNSRTMLDYSTLRIAIGEDANVQNGLLDAFCKMNKINYLPVYAKDNDECRQLLKEGKADVTISKDVNVNPGYSVVARFAPIPFCFASSNENSEIIATINTALTAIDSAEPSFASDLYKKYFSNPSDHIMALTQDELDYLETEPVIKVGVPIDCAPIQDYDEDTGEFKGIAIDLLNVMSQNSGLAMELVPIKSTEHLEQLLVEDSLDVVASLAFFYDEKLISGVGGGLLLTSPMFSSPVVRLSNIHGMGENPEIIVSNSIMMFSNQGNTVYSDSIKEIFSFINSGKYAEAYVNGYIAQHHLEKGGNGNVALTSTPYSNYDLCLGVVRNRDLRLVNILNQAIASIPNSAVEDIIFRNTSHTPNTSIWCIIKRDPMQLAIPALIITLVIVGLLLMLFFNTRRINKLISKEKNEYKAISQIDRLAQTYNNCAFKQMAHEYLSCQTSMPFGALIVCDIDNFKIINDTLGHLMGDEVIAKTGTLLSTIFREDDIVGRLGGDEFGVLMKNVASLTTIEMRCEELKAKSISIIDEHDVTISVGVAIFDGNISFDEIFMRADSALYDVKNGSKNAHKIYVESEFVGDLQVGSEI